MLHWFEYVKVCFDLVIASERDTQVVLGHDTEAYVVHLMARNFERTDIGHNPVAIKILENYRKQDRTTYSQIGDECLLIQSYPFKKAKWPSETYYTDMGRLAYYMADNQIMHSDFKQASLVLSGVFKQINNQ